MEELAIGLALKSALPIYEIDQQIQGMIVVWVNLQERPDIAEFLTRQDKGGLCIASLFYKNPGTRELIVGLRIEMRQSSHAVFCLAFEVERYFDQLVLFTQSGWISVAPGPPERLVEIQETGMPIPNKEKMEQCFLVDLGQDLVAQMRSRLD